MSEERKIKRVKFTLDVLFDEPVDLNHVKKLSKRVVETLKQESDSGQGLGDDNAVPVEIRAMNEQTGIAIQTYQSTKEGWVESFIDAGNKENNENTPKEKWENLKRYILEQIDNIDKETVSNSQNEPEWWLEMSTIARNIQQYLK